MSILNNSKLSKCLPKVPNENFTFVVCKLTEYESDMENCVLH